MRNSANASEPTCANRKRKLTYDSDERNVVSMLKGFTCH